MKTQITPDDIELSEETYLKLDAIAAKACKPGCECSIGEGSQCADRWGQNVVLGKAARQIAASERGWKDDSSLDDWTPSELSLIVAACAKLRKVHDDPKVRRLVILLDNGSSRAARLVRLWRKEKITFEKMLDAALPRMKLHVR